MYDNPMIDTRREDSVSFMMPPIPEAERGPWLRECTRLELKLLLHELGGAPRWRVWMCSKFGHKWHVASRTAAGDCVCCHRCGAPKLDDQT